MKWTNPEDTIAAVATPQGEGGIGIVRVSGPDAIALVQSIFVSSRGRDIANRARQVFHGEVRDDGGGPVDEVLVHVMPAPHSYTREDVVEINCHGGPAPLNAVLELVLRHGARLAEPGEFTRRAFLNGRIDLVQAEAVIDRIRAQTRAGLQAASAAASGRLSQTIHEIRAHLVRAKSQVEAAVDFPEQDVPDLITPGLRQEIEDVRARMEELVRTADAGRLYREGASVAIVGRPNVGKSSLFNALLRDARAIVTAQAGTTRDILEEVITIRGVPVRLTDMAGLRETRDEVERAGIERARGALHRAAVVLFVVDLANTDKDADQALLDEIVEARVPAILVQNKKDLVDEATVPTTLSPFVRAVRISATTGAGLEELEECLGEVLLGGLYIAPDQSVLTRLHQKDSLRRALEAVERLLANFDASPEFLSVDLEDALSALGEITGETTPDEILGQIFSSFCIGK